MQRINFQAKAEADGLRLDVWLTQKAPSLSRSRIQALIGDGHVTADGHRVTPHSRVHRGMQVTVEIPPARPAGLQAEAIPLDVLHEDGDIIAVNKPPGLVVHPAAGHDSGTLVNALLHHCPDLAGIGGEQRPGIVHRLDKDTSGVLVVAKNDLAHRALVEQFKARSVRKEYRAAVHGVPSPAAGRIETAIGRSGHDRKRMSARPPVGRQAVSHYDVAEAFAGAALLRVRIETGRTHQIRVHMAHIGHPIVGDRQYGSRTKDRDLGIDAPRQMLHAATLSIRHPRTGRVLDLKAPLPRDMDDVLQCLREKVSAGEDRVVE